MRRADFLTMTSKSESEYATQASRQQLPFWTAGGGKWSTFSAFDAFLTVLTGELAEAGCDLRDAARVVRDSAGNEADGPRFLSEQNWKKITAGTEDCYFGRVELRKKNRWAAQEPSDNVVVCGPLKTILKGVGEYADENGQTARNLVIVNATDTWRRVAALAKLGGIDISNVFEREGE